ncbi:hypothetical protein Pan54_07880 [Rubinisphaera italica]|uniref:Uncharacterized protein n=1 Tax=Rubinisphaera italica TaxID=2527969 RepID=A0A5C5XD81_9PLAN|nr:hypothetical protein Pan54_07880 [Rubinisphaera italica]
MSCLSETKADGGKRKAGTILNQASRRSHATGGYESFLICLSRLFMHKDHDKTRAMTGTARLNLLCNHDRLSRR